MAGLRPGRLSNLFGRESLHFSGAALFRPNGPVALRRASIAMAGEPDYLVAARKNASAAGVGAITRDELAAVVRAAMPQDKYDKPGAVLMSGVDTIRPGPFYLMGLNPGGNPATLTRSIVDGLAPPDGTSPYTDECWNKACGDADPCAHNASGRMDPGALVRHQRNMIALAATLGATPAMLPSANAIFARSISLAELQRQTNYSADDWWQACWPVHQHLLSIVRPRVILTLGYGETTSPLGMLRREARADQPVRIGDVSRAGGWTFNALLTVADGSVLEAQVIGMPHPSYYAPGAGLIAAIAKLAG